MNQLQQQLRDGYQVARVPAFHEVGPSALAFRDELFELGEENVAITRPGLLVVTRRFWSEDERGDVADLFVGQPRIDAQAFAQHFVLLDGHRVPPRTVVQSGRLLGAELTRVALAPGSRLLTPNGVLQQSLRWADPECRIPRPASQALLSVLKVACVL